jgi:CRISPR-associated protein Csb2
MQLQIKLRFPARRYHGRRSEDELEFPPAPARLFQALIAGSHCGVYGVVHTDARDRALRWLETLEPPVIEAPAVCQTGAGITNYVPNNDNKLEHIRTAKSFLANVFPPDATLIFRWRFAASVEAEENAAMVCAMAKLITHLGQHQDVVYASGAVTDDDATADGAFLPAERPDGEWAAPRPGALAAYQERYQAWLRGENKDNFTIPVRCVHYRPPNTLSFDAPLALFELWRKEDERRRFDPRELRQPAAMVRHALIDWLEAHPAFIKQYGQDLTSRLIAGHEADRQHDGSHIACVPLPSLNAEGQADGWLRRVLLVGYGCEDAMSQELFDSIADGINGAALLDQGKPKGYLKRATPNDAVLRQFIGKGQRVWRTVTPIILTGLMRRGRGAEVLIARALKQTGINEEDIESIAVFSGPIVPKSVHALDYQIEKSSYLAQTPRYHAEIIFKRPVEGILVVGRGKHCGFGLLMPCLENAPNYPAHES